MSAVNASPVPRFGATLSISSRNSTQGAAARARLNRSRTRCADWPMYWAFRSAVLPSMNLTPLSFAMVRAISVLPVPGGPYSRIFGMSALPL